MQIEVVIVSVRNTKGMNLGIESAFTSINNKGADLLGFTKFGVGSAVIPTGANPIAIYTRPRFQFCNF